MAKTKTITLRVTDAWYHTLEKLVERLRLNPEKHRSKVIREMVSREAQIWNMSPYIADKTKVLIIVPARGAKVFWFGQRLILTAACEHLPTTVAIMPESKSHFENEDANSAQNARDKWLINYFAAWSGDRIGKHLIVQETDRLGEIVKFAPLPVHQPKDAAVAKEILACCDEYIAPYIPGKPEHDRSDIAIDVPTLELDVQVVVDLDRYPVAHQRKYAGMDFELRNRERVRFSEAYRQSIGFDWENGRYPQEGYVRRSYAQCLNTVRNSVKSLEERLSELTREDALAQDGRPVVENQEHRNILRSVTLPESFLFGRVQWKMPFQNVIVSVTWNKPELKDY